MASKITSHGVTTRVLDSALELPDLIAGSKLGDIATLRTGEGWVLDRINNGPLYWLQFAGAGGASPGAKVKYIVAQAGTPMALAGTYPTHDLAGAAAIADVGGNPALLRADFITMPGTYPGFRMLPGMHIELAGGESVQPGPIPPNPAQIDSPPFVLTSTVQMVAADGWNVVPGIGVPTPNASLNGAVIDTGAASCFEIGAGVVAGTVTMSHCVLRTTGIAINEVAPGPYVPGAPSPLIQFDASQIEAFGAVASNTVLARLSFFNGCRLQGSFSTQQVEGLTFQNSYLVFAYVTASMNAALPNTGNANVRFIHSTTVSVDGNPVLTLNEGCRATFDAGSLVQPNGAPVTITGNGGVVLLEGGTLAGFVSAPSTIVFAAVTSGTSLCVPTAGGSVADIDANSYVAVPPGGGVYTLLNGIEYVVFDCSACAPGDVVAVTLPDARDALQFSGLRIKRIDQIPTNFTVLCQGTNELDKTVPPTTSFTLGPGASLNLIASREPSTVPVGIGRWLVMT